MRSETAVLAPRQARLSKVTKLEPKSVERRLAAILAADVVGYSRLMGADEVGTLRALKGLRRDLIDPAVAAHRGRIIKTTNNGVLIDFASAVDAVACAVAVQRNMLERYKDMPEARRIVFRVGINVGDIIIDDKDIFGDSVNIAARLEGLCEPGGLCSRGCGPTGDGRSPWTRQSRSTSPSGKSGKPSNV